MNITTYLIGSFYIVRSLFRFSEHITNYIISEKILELPNSKYEKINESIYSSLHGILVSTTASFSITNSLFEYNKDIIEKDNTLQYLTASICFSYFVIDIFKCLYYKKYLFILHHLASIYLLVITFYSFHLKENKGFYAMYLIFLLESNTLLLNIGFLLKELKFHYSITCTVWIIHLFCFFMCRIITIPKILFYYYYYEKINMRSLMLAPAFFMILSGSIYWTYRQTIGIHKYLREHCVV